MGNECNTKLFSHSILIIMFWKTCVRTYSFALPKNFESTNNASKSSISDPFMDVDVSHFAFLNLTPNFQRLRFTLPNLVEMSIYKLFVRMYTCTNTREQTRKQTFQSQTHKHWTYIPQRQLLSCNWEHETKEGLI